MNFLVKLFDFTNKTLSLLQLKDDHKPISVKNYELINSLNILKLRLSIRSDMSYL